MKYFTPELLARCRSEDDAIADVASEEWERRNKDYEKYLDGIRPLLSGSRSIRYLLNKLRLHDAKVYSMALDEDPHFSIFVQAHDQKDGALELRYRLVSPPRLGPHECLAQGGQSSGYHWLYDEIGVREGLYVFTHSILFAEGVELQLEFNSLSCRHLIWAFPPGHNMDPKTTVVHFVDGKDPPESPRWKLPAYLPLGA